MLLHRQGLQSAPPPPRKEGVERRTSPSNLDVYAAIPMPPSHTAPRLHPPIELAVAPEEGPAVAEAQE